MGKSLKTSEVAEFFDVSTRTVAAWKAAGCPCRSGGRGRQDEFDSAAVHRWLLGEAVGDGAGKDPEIKAVRLEILRTEAKVRALRLAERERRLVEVDDVETCLSAMIEPIRDSFYGWVPTLATDLLLLDRTDEHRILCHNVYEKLRECLYRSYMSARILLGDLAGQSERKAARIAAETWKQSFGSAWEEKGDLDELALVERLVQIMLDQRKEDDGSIQHGGKRQKGGSDVE